MQKSEVFEQVYREYLKKVSRIDLNWVNDRLGLNLAGGDVIIPFYGVPHRISAQGITDDQGRRPSHSVSVILCKYLLMCPKIEPTETDWVTYKDFKDAVPFAGPVFPSLRKARGKIPGHRVPGYDRLGTFRAIEAEHNLKKWQKRLRRT